TGSLDQRVVYEACRRGILDRQLPILRRHYAHKRDVMEQALRREMGGAVTGPKPKGGFFLWGTRPCGVRPAGLVSGARDRGVRHVTGDAFNVNGDGHDTLRLSFSAPTPERIEAGVQRLAATLRGELAARETADAAEGPAAS